LSRFLKLRLCLKKNRSVFDLAEKKRLERTQEVRAGKGREGIKCSDGNLSVAHIFFTAL